MVASVAVLRQLVVVMRSVKQTYGAEKSALSTFRTPVDSAEAPDRTGPDPALTSADGPNRPSGPGSRGLPSAGGLWSTPRVPTAPGPGAIAAHRP